MIVQPMALAIMMATVPIPEPPGMDEDGLAGLKLRVVEQHVLNGGEGDRCAGGIAIADAIEDRNDKTLRQIHQLAEQIHRHGNP